MASNPGSTALEVTNVSNLKLIPRYSESRETVLTGKEICRQSSSKEERISKDSSNAEVAPLIGRKLVLYQETVILYSTAIKVVIWSIFCNFNIGL